MSPPHSDPNLATGGHSVEEVFSGYQGVSTGDVTGQDDVSRLQGGGRCIDCYWFDSRPGRIGTGVSVHRAVDAGKHFLWVIAANGCCRCLSFILV